MAAVTNAPVDRWRRIAPDYFDHCWKSTERPHRKPVMDAIGSMMPAASLLEIGCNAGVNLRMARDRWPALRLGGVEVSKRASGYVTDRLPSVQVHDGDLRDVLPTLEASSWDIVLTCYCLAYIEPGEIHSVLTNMVRVARVGLVIAEPMVFDHDGTSRRYEAGIPEWMHNYRAFFRPTFSCSWSTAIEPAVERLEYVLTVRL